MVRKRKNKERKSTLRKIILIGLFFCVCAILAYFLIWSPYFWVKQIKVTSSEEPAYFNPESIEQIAKNVLEQKIWQIIPLKSVFLVQENQIIQQVYQQFPGVELVRIKTEFPDSLVVAIEQRQQLGIWCQVEYEDLPIQQESASATSTQEIELVQQRKINDCFEIDRQGIIFNSSPLVRGEMILNIYSSPDNVQVGGQVLTSDLLDFINGLYQKIKKVRTIDNNKLSVSEFEVFSIEDVRGETKFGWQIYFNPADSIDSQLNALERVLREEISKNYSNLEYMDLRIKGRVYYKEKQ